MASAFKISAYESGPRGESFYVEGKRGDFVVTRVYDSTEGFCLSDGSGECQHALAVTRHLTRQMRSEKKQS